MQKFIQINGQWWRPLGSPFPTVFSWLVCSLSDVYPISFRLENKVPYFRRQKYYFEKFNSFKVPEKYLRTVFISLCFIE